MTVLLFEALLEGGLQPLRLSDAPWRTPAGDPDGFRMFPGDLIGDPEFSQQVACVLWSERSATAISALEVNNADGRYDWLLGVDAADSRCEFRLAEPGQEWGDAETVWRGIVLRIEAPSRERIRIVLDTLAALLRRPMMTQQVTDKAGNEVSSPVWVGQCYSVPAMRTDTPDLDYLVADCRINGLSTVFSAGAPYDPAQWAYDAERIGFESLIDPGETMIHADGFGSFGFGSNVLPTPDLDAWTSGVPTGYTEISTGSGTITEVPGVGARIQWGAGDYIRLITGTVLPDTDAGWYLIKGRIARLSEGLLYCLFRNEPATLVQVRHAGDFAILTYVPAGADRTFWWGSDDTNAGDLVLDYIEVRKVGANQSQLLPYALEQVTQVHGPLRYGQINSATVTALTSAANKQVGIFVEPGSSKTLDAMLSELLAGWTGWYWIDELGELRVGRLEAPDQSGAPDLALTELDIIGGVQVRVDLAPNLSDSYAGRKNFYVFTFESLAGLPQEDAAPLIAQYRHVRKATVSPVFHPTYARARGADPVGTLTAGGDTQVLDEANRVVPIYGVQRRFYVVSASLRSARAALALQPGALVRLTHSRHGLEAGRNLLLVGKRCRFRSSRVELTLWG